MSGKVVALSVPDNVLKCMFLNYKALDRLTMLRT